MRKQTNTPRERIQGGPDSPGRSGFTLVELLIVIAIVGIIAAFAYPSYRQNVLKSHRSDAKVALTQTAQTLERCYSQYGGYKATDSSGKDLCQIIDKETFKSPKDFYRIKVTIPNRSQYTLKATALGSQTDDTPCEYFQLNQAGRETATNTDQCW